MLVRYFTLLMGTAFTLAGIGGFLPGISRPASPDMPSLAIDTSYGLLLGLFPVNLVHNLIHLGIGIWGLAAYRSAQASLIFTRSLAVVLAVFTVMGLLPALSTTFGLLPLFGHDIWLHGLEALIAFYLGWVYHPTVRLIERA